MADISQIRLPSGDTFDLIDEKSGYITAQYIENKTDYSIPVSRVGEIVVGETAIGTDSTNFPTSKAVVDYVDERVVQEIEAIDVGVTGIKANGTSLAIENGVVNIPAIGPGQSVGLMTEDMLDYIYSDIPTSTSQLTNDSGFITSETDPTVPDWAKAATKPTYTASEVGALPSSTVIPQIFRVSYNPSTNTADKTYTEITQAKNRGDLVLLSINSNYYWMTSSDVGYLFTTIDNLSSSDGQGNKTSAVRQLKLYTNNTWYINGDYKLPRNTSDLTNDSGFITASSIPTTVSSFTNDAGYLTSSDIASVLTYKGTKASYSALPSSGNSTGDVWHVTDTGAEYAWDGSTWQELGTAIDVSGFVSKSGDAMSGNLDLDTNFLLFKNDNVSIKLTGTHYYQSNSDTTFYGVVFSSGMNDASILLRNIRVPFADTDAANKKYVDNAISAISIPTKTSDLTNDSGFLTSYTETDPIFTASPAHGIAASDITNWNAKTTVQIVRW